MPCSALRTASAVRLPDLISIYSKEEVKAIGYIVEEHHTTMREQGMMKEVLGKENGDAAHDKKENLDIEKDLIVWLKETPIYLVLQ